MCKYPSTSVLVPVLSKSSRLDVTSYSHYESQRGSTLRSTQITTFFGALALPFSSLSLLPSLFLCRFPSDKSPLHLEAAFRQGKSVRKTHMHTQATHCCGPELHLRVGIMSADQGLLAQSHPWLPASLRSASLQGSRTKAVCFCSF